jgi:uncharacterized protein YbjQ (UPF0145 family)
MELIVVLFLLAVGYVFGKRVETSHFRELVERERKLAHFPIHSGKALPQSTQRCFVVARSVVISDDYFKKFAAGLKSLIGGRLTTYETLLDRARREATLRAKERAIELGAQGIVHFRLETSSIFGDETQGAMGIVQVTAYGTAYS